MRYSSENFSDFEFHDTELYLKDCENSNLRLTARYLNIHKEAEQNPHNCDMETDCAEILFENADIRLFEIVEQASSLTDHHKQTSARMMVFGVDFEVLGELLNSAGEQRYLHFGRARVALFASVLCDDFLFLKFIHCLTSFVG